MIAIYDSTTGKFVAYVESMNSVSKALPPGIVAQEVGDVPKGMVWNEASRTFVPPPNPSVISCDSFIRRFTSEEIVKLMGFERNEDFTEERKDRIRMFVWYMGSVTEIYLKDVLVVQSVKYLETCGILDEGRANQILT